MQAALVESVLAGLQKPLEAHITAERKEFFAFVQKSSDITSRSLEAYYRKFVAQKMKNALGVESIEPIPNVEKSAPKKKVTKPIPVALPKDSPIKEKRKSRAVKLVAVQKPTIKKKVTRRAPVKKVVISDSSSEEDSPIKEKRKSRVVVSTNTDDSDEIDRAFEDESSD